ncbi:MAG: GNAT family N-acetyltransferase [Rubrobacteraceae bacterium]
MTTVEPLTIRPAEPGDDPAIAALVVEGFLDQFIPIFGGVREVSNKIMQKWVELEHASGGVRSLVAESGDEVVASVGLRAEEAHEEVLARGLWKALRRNLGLLRAFWATALLSYPRYTPRPTEAYVERLVVTPAYRQRGIARKLLHRAENMGREADKETVGLHVSENNEPAIQLYKNEGYVESSRQRSLMTGYFLGIREWIYLKKTL